MPVAPSNIVFDVGNVLIEWDPRNLYRRIFDDPARMEWFLANVFTSAVNLECDRGLSFADAVAMVTARHPEHAAAIRAFDGSSYLWAIPAPITWGSSLPSAARASTMISLAARCRSTSPE